MIVLAVDTCLGACTAAIGEAGEVRAAISEPMMRGHQERLAPMVRELMVGAGLDFGELDRVAATVGPGSFTGLRVGLSFARAMALALDIPCAGIGTFPALAHGHDGLTLAIADARRGQAYWQVFEAGAPLSEPAADEAAAIAAWFAGRGPVTVVGPGAAMMAGRLAEARIVEQAAPQAQALIELGAAADPAAPAPIYIRPPDAKLPGGKTPPP